MREILRDVLARGSERLRAAKVESARLDARVLLAKAIGVASEDVFICRAPSRQQVLKFERLIERRAGGEPLAYITGEKEFWNLRFEVGPGVLIPRPETETLIEESLRNFPEPEAALRVLDIGTGSGCLLVAFLVHRRSATGVGTDISKSALALAMRNAERHGVGERCRFVEAEWETPGDPPFDVVLANPPYLSENDFRTAQPEIRDYEPREAFVAGPDGLGAMPRIAAALARRLGSKGRAFVEVGAGQAEAVAEIVRGCGLEVRKITPDLSGVARCLVIGRLEQGA